ncbi:MAG: hypothetical protein IT377_22075 [Polyangiaceae bacterium]|nr:hypothetical protein [Polyangiaceae bacterium]
MSTRNVHRLALVVSLFAGVAAVPLAALADDAPPPPLSGAPSSGPAPAEATPAETPAASAPSAPPAPPAGVSGTTCLTFNNGLDPASAATGGQIVCDEIRAAGVPLVSPGTPSANAYRVFFDRLGRQLVVRVTYEAPIGSVRRSERVTLSGVEQVSVAAPRLARAIVLGQPLESTQQVDNLVAEETRKYDKKPGEFLWGLGILGTSAPTENRWMSPGIEFMGYYETPDYGFGFSLRSSLATGDKSLSGLSASVGGRYFFSQSDTSLFVGGGLGISYLGLRNNDYESSEPSVSGSGLATFGEAGVELMRLHSSRMIVGLRAELPFYSLKQSSYYYDSAGGASEQVESRWVMPVTVSATYAW